MRAVILFGCGLAAALSVAGAEEQTLFELTPQFNLTKVTAQDAVITATNEAGQAVLRVDLHHRAQWPGVTFVAPGGRWDLSGNERVIVDWKNIGTNALQLSCRVDNPKADGTSNCVNGWTELEPGKTGTIDVFLQRTAGDNLGGKLFGMRGFPVGGKGPEMVDPANITQILLFAAKPEADHSFAVTRIRAMGSYTAPTASVTDADPFFPFIDTFGQYAHKDWPGKTHSLDEMEARRKEEAAAVNQPGWLSNWDRYGGWTAGPTLEATGFFRAQKYKGKWWLVDPDGHLFFSQG